MNVLKMTKTPLTSGLLLFAAPVVFILILPVPHTIALRLLTLLILFISALFLYKKAAVPPIPHKTVIALWLAMALISLFWAIDPSYSANEIKVEVGYGILAYLGFYIFAHDEKSVKVLLWALLVASLGVCIATWIRQDITYDWLEPVRRFALGVGSSSTYIVTVLPMLGLLVWITLSSSANWKKTVLWSLFFLSIGMALFFAALIGQNRMIWIVIAAQLFVLLFLLKKPKTTIKLLLSLLVMALVLGGYAYVSLQKGEMKALNLQSMENSFANDPRIELWGRVLPILKEKPWTGEGFGRRALAKAHVEFSGNITKWHAHNLFLDYIAQMGVGGFIVLSLLFGSIVWRFISYLEGPNPLYVIGVTGIIIVVGVLAKNMTDDFFNRDLALLFWLEIGILLGWGERLHRRYKDAQAS